MSLTKQEKTTMGNKTSQLPPPDARIVYDPKVTYLSQARADVYTQKTALSDRLSVAVGNVGALGSRIDTISSTTALLPGSISANSYKVWTLSTQSLGPLATVQNGVVASQNAFSLQVSDFGYRLGTVETNVSAVNVSDLSNRFNTTGAGVQGIADSTTGLETYFVTQGGLWPALDLLRANVKASMDTLTTYHGVVTTLHDTVSTYVSNVSVMALSQTNDMNSYRAFVSATLWSMSKDFASANTSIASQTNANLAALQATATAITTRVNTASANLWTSVTNGFSTFGLRAIPPGVVIINTATPMAITTDLHNKIIFTNQKNCLYFGLNLPVTASGAAKQTNPDYSPNNMFTMASTDDNKCTIDSRIVNAYPDGLCFTVVYYGPETTPQPMCFFRYVYINAGVVPFTYPVLACSWFVGSSGSAAEFGNAMPNAKTVFRVGSLSSSARRCTVTY